MPPDGGRAGTSRSLCVGGWWVDRATNEIGREGRVLRLEPKVMDVLIALAEQPGAVLSREKLLADVWRGVVVGDEALTQSIIKLRKAVGDHPRSPSFIETIPKRGYRLIAPVAGGSNDATTPGDAPTNAADPAAAAADAPAARGTSTPATEVSRPGEGPAATPRAGTLAEAGALAEPATVATFRRRPLAWIASAVAVVAILTVGIYVVARGTLPSRPSVASSGTWRASDDGPTALPTVSVLPFETVGAGREQAWLAQGIRSDLMTDLSRLAEVRVINARGAAATARGMQAARYVVAGSVQRDAGTLRINVRLTDARTGMQLWSRRYERPFGDLLAIQNEISRALVHRLPATLSEAERRRLAQPYTRSTEAYEDFLRARGLFLVRRPDANAQARALYTKALDLDPQFARAYAGLAMTYAMDYRYQQSSPSTQSLERARELAETARQIDPGIPEVYWAIGFVDAQGRHHQQAVEALAKAIELNRSYADAYALMGGIYTYLGEPDRTIPLLRTALRFNPEGGYLYFLLLGRAYLFENDLDQALFNLREAARRNPEDLETHIYLAAALVAAGDRRDAESEADEVKVRDQNFSMRNWLRTYPLSSPGEVHRLVELTARVQL